MKRTSFTLMGLAFAAAAGLFVPLQAQEVDPGLRPYLGCWEPEGADVEEGILCFVAAGSGLEMLTVIDDAVEFREPFAADGRSRAVEQDGCRGTESARMSDDGQRIYTFSDFRCEDEPASRSTGIISMTSPFQWLDVRAMEVDGETMAWSQSYNRVSDRLLEDLGHEPTDRSRLRTRELTARSTGQITVEDVIDASRAVDDEAVEAWIAERGQPFASLDADDLIRLDDAGVAEDVIDVVVAVSFPNRFALRDDEARGERDYYGRRAGRPIWARPMGFYDPFYYGYGYSPFYGGYGYGFGYGRWGGGYAPVRVIVDRVRESGGRVVNGRGYRQGGSRSVGSGVPSSTGRSGVGRSSGGSRVSPPSSGSSGSKGGGRKAKRRGGS